MPQNMPISGIEGGTPLTTEEFLACSQVVHRSETGVTDGDSAWGIGESGVQEIACTVSCGPDSTSPHLPITSNFHPQPLPMSPYPDPLHTTL